MPVKREPMRSANQTSRKTRVTWSGLYCSKSNPDRVIETTHYGMEARKLIK
jgi:hypothetical protein